MRSFFELGLDFCFSDRFATFRPRGAVKIQVPFDVFVRPQVPYRLDPLRGSSGSGSDSLFDLMFRASAAGLSQAILMNIETYSSHHFPTASDSC